MYVAGYLLHQPTASPAAPTVSGIDVGGLTPAAAQTRAARRAWRQRAAEPIPVVRERRAGAASLRPPTAGLTVDVPATVAQAGGGRSWDPGRMWDYFAGGERRGRRWSRVDQAAARRGRSPRSPTRSTYPPTEGAVDLRRRRRPTRRYPEKGIGRRPRRRRGRGAAAPSCTTERPRGRAAHRRGRPAGQQGRRQPRDGRLRQPGDVRVRSSSRWRARASSSQPEDFAPALSMQAVGGELQPELDEPGAGRRAAAQDAARSPRSPKDASFRVVRGGRRSCRPAPGSPSTPPT